MSMEALRWARRVRALPTHKLILWAMADFANDHMECWPSLPALMEATGLSDRGIQKAVAQMAEAGLVEVVRSAGGRSNTYRLTLAEPRTTFGVRRKKNPEPRSPNPEPGSPSTPNPVHPDPEPRSGGTPNEPPIEPKGTPMRAKRAVPAPGFETHIEVLPPWLPPDAWDAWCQHRTRKARKMWTRGAAEYSIRELAKAVAQGDDAREIIERSIGSGWTGLFPSKNPRQATTMLDLTIQRQMERRAQPQEHYDDE